MSDENLQTSPPVAAPAPTAETVVKPTDVGPRRKLTVTQLIIAVVVLGVGVFFTVRTSDVREAPDPGIKLVPAGQSFFPDTLRAWKPHAPFLSETFQVQSPTLPAEVGGWRGLEAEMSMAEKQILPPDTGFARRYYMNDKNQQLYCSLVLEGKDVASIHRPEVCLVGQGWKLQNAPEIEVFVPKLGGTLKVSHLIGTQELRSPDGKSKVRHEMVFAYWFVGRDRVTPSHFYRYVVSMKDRILHSRSHRWAYFLLASPVERPPEGHPWVANEKQAAEAIRQFVSDVYPEVCNVPLK